MTHPILYLGDTSLATAASYLAGVMYRAGLLFDHKASHEGVSPDDVAGRKLIIVSDYPAARCSPAAQAAMAHAVEGGAGLLMLGGWESFHGLGGDWDATALTPLLPVVISAADDRINGDGVALLRLTDAGACHEATASLPWDARPPVVGGWSRFSPKAGARVLLEVVPHRTRREGSGFAFMAGPAEPMLVVGNTPGTRVACLATDAAPHWVGPLVDWGTDNTAPSCAGRVKAQAPGAEAIEVGALYAQFLEQLVRWTGRL